MSPHDKTNKWHVRPVKTQISLGIHQVWSESSLSAWRKLGSLATYLGTSDWVDAQADLRFRWAHSHFFFFFHEVAHLFIFACLRTLPFISLFWFKCGFQQFFSHITMVSGCDRELNARFYSAASLSFMLQTLNMIPHPGTLSWQWVDKSLLYPISLSAKRGAAVTIF